MKKSGKLSEAANELMKEAAESGKEVDESELITLVQTHAAAAAVAAMGAGVLPGAGGLIATGIGGAAVLAMYVRIGKYLQLTVKKGLLKALVSAVVSNLSINLAGLLITSFVPGLSIIACGIMNYGLVYTAGAIYLKVLTGIFRVGGNPEKMTKEQMEEQFQNAAKSVNTKDIFSEAKGSFKQMKEDGSLNERAKEADISEDAIPDDNISEE